MHTDIPFDRAAKEIEPSPGACVRFALRHCSERRFFLSDTGYMGLAPSEANVGYGMYLFVGPGIPLIVRENKAASEDGKRLHRLVEEGYVEIRPWMAIRSKPRSEANIITIV
jgi:hypothetical protein